MVKSSQVLKQQKQAPTQVTKVKIPPTWARESFSDYKAEVEAWKAAHPGDELEDKYELTKKEKFEGLINKLKSFKTNKSDSGESIFGKIEAEFDSLDIKNNLKHFLATWFVKEAFENEVMNEIEKRSVQDLIEKKNYINIMSEVKKEFKKMKIEGQRESNKIDAENDEDKTYYVVNNGRSRYDAWRNSRKNRDVKRSNSNNWRT